MYSSQNTVYRAILKQIWRSRTLFKQILILLGTSFVLLGCQLVLLDPGTVSTTESLDAGTDGDGTLVGLSDVESKLIDRAMAELVAEQNVLMDQITFVGIEAVEWPDASLGCPQDDMMSAQVITPGYRIVLETDSKTYQYHTGATEDSLLIRCEDE